MSDLQSNILIVDDSPENLRLLRSLLTSHGYKVRPAPNGELALSGARAIPPDLILLDILMPGMDGYQVCEALKADPATRDIPVIFISAFNEVVDKVKAFEVGAADFINKPFHVEEVIARVESQLATRKQRVDQLEQQEKEVERLNAEMRRQMADRSRQLFAVLTAAEAADAAALSFAVGDLVHDRYRVTGEIGAGGMGVVYGVQRVSDERSFALKITRGLARPELARLAREAQIICQVDHPNVVGIEDLDVADNGLLYLVMELIEGASLRSYEQRYGDSGWALPILRQIASGLAILHGVGIIHRDLKPENVLLSKVSSDEPQVKITDFGVSRMYIGGAAPGANTVRRRTGENSSEAPTRAVGRPAAIDLEIGDTAQEASPRSGMRLTETGVLTGTPDYMAPEIRGSNGVFDPSADIFSFGIIAYELLTGKRPFESPPIFTPRVVKEARYQPLDKRVPGLDGVVPALIHQSLQLDPARRPTAKFAATVFKKISPEES